MPLVQICTPRLDICNIYSDNTFIYSHAIFIGTHISSYMHTHKKSVRRAKSPILLLFCSVYLLYFYIHKIKYLKKIGSYFDLTHDLTTNVQVNIIDSWMKSTNKLATLWNEWKIMKWFKILIQFRRHLIRITNYIRCYLPSWMVEK